MVWLAPSIERICDVMEICLCTSQKHLFPEARNQQSSKNEQLLMMIYHFPCPREASFLTPALGLSVRSSANDSSSRL